jgi:hypothetical protein
MHKNATKCNETLSKWCKNKHGASKIMDTLEIYHRGRGTSSGLQRSSTAPAAAPTALLSYDEYRDMPCFVHRDATEKGNHTNQNCKFINNIKADQEAGYERTRQPRPHGK